MRTCRITAVWLAVTATAAGAQTVTLDAVATALGGRDRLLAVRTAVLEGTGQTLNFGQNQTPYAENTFQVTSYRAAIDYANRRWFIDLTRVPQFTTGNMNPQRQRLGLDGAPNGVAYNIAGNGTMQRAPAQAAADRMHEFVYTPIGFMMAANRPDADVSVENAANNQARIRINPGGHKYAMYVDRRTMMPTAIERIVYHPMLGDVQSLVELSDWTEVDGIKVPGRLRTLLAGRWITADYRITATRLNGDVGSIAATDSVRGVTLQSGPAAPTVAVDSVASGVWVVGGQSHHTIAIEQSNGVVLVEAPQNDARTLAAIARARELRPAKPLELLINTHHHFDHAGGLRAAASQGLPIMTHEGNRDFYERFVLAGQHVIQQDALARNPQRHRVTPVSGKLVLRDPLRPIEVYPVEGNAHSQSMLIVYLPNERILIQADLYNPPAPTATNPVFPFVANLVQNVERLGLQVDRVVGIHGRPVPWSELKAAATRAPQ